jgi:hypothetical protein
LYPLLKETSQKPVIYLIEASGDISLDDPLEPHPGVTRPPAQSAQGVMSRSKGAKPPREWVKDALIDGFQEHFDRGLYRPVSDRSDAQWSRLPVCFRDIDPFHRLWSEVFGQQFLSELLNQFLPSILPGIDFRFGLSIYTGCVTSLVCENCVQARA